MPVAEPMVGVPGPTAIPAAPETVHQRWWTWFGWPLAGLLLAALRAPGFSLNGDVRYTLGALRTTAEFGFGPAEVWAHRPMTNRLLMAGADQLTWGDFAQREAMWLLLGGLVCGATGGCLARALRPLLGPGGGAGVSIGVVAALVWAPQRDVWQPEWTAAWLAAAGVAAGLSSRWWGSFASAVFLVAASLMKYTTATSAAVALLVLAAVQVRRAVVVASLTAAVGAVVLVLQLGLVPVERMWFTELSALNSSFTGQWACQTGDAWSLCPPHSLLATMGMISPVLLVWPAATLALVWQQRGRARRAAALVPPVAVLVVAVGVVAQSSWYSYQLALLPVLAAAWLGWAVATSPWRVRILLGVSSVLAAGLTAWLMSAPLDVRKEAPPLFGTVPRTELAYWGQLVLLLVLALLVAAILARRSRPGRTVATGPEDAAAARRDRVPGLAAAAVVCVAAASALLPSMPFSYGFQLGGYTPASEKERRAKDLTAVAEINRRIGSDAPVVYLAFGEDSYLLDHPTPCRYAAATYLQRNLWADTIHLRGATENLACLADPRAEYAVVNGHWMKLERSRATQTRLELERWFDCSRDVGVRPWQVCPRR